MPLTTLLRAAGGFRHASHSFRALTPIPYRTLFYPSGPPPALDSATEAKFPHEVRAHLSERQFDTVRNSREVFSRRYFNDIVGEGSNVPIIGPSTPPEIWEQNSDRFVQRQRQPAGKHTGRTVEIRHGEDVGQAYARLQAILRNNNVRMELRLTERHEKKGAKRRRLRSERWRRKFADEVRKKVKLVTEIRLRDRMWGARH